MFTNLFSRKSNKSKTGFYKIIEGNKLKAMDDIPGNGSINNAIESLGFPRNHIRTVNTFNSDKTNCLGFKTLSKELVFVLAKSPDTKLSIIDVLSEVALVDWAFEYSSLNIEDILNEGIEMSNFSIDFLKSVIDLSPEDENVFRSKQLGLYLQFDNELLTAFTSSGWESTSTKWLNNLNSLMVSKMKEEASKFHDNEIDIMEEVNNQTKALLNIPSAVENEYIPLHRKSNNNINFYNLLLTHYTQKCSLSEFLFMNKGRFKQIEDRTYEIGKFIYEFDYNDNLIAVLPK